jgi:hypothetical protein
MGVLQMNLKNRILFILAAFLVLGGAFLSRDISRAQQNPGAVASPTVSPTPEQIEDDDEPIKIDTEVVNVLFTAQDKNVVCSSI